MKKKYLIAIAAFCLSLSASAQKLEKPKIDKITGDTSLMTSQETVYQKVNFLTGESITVKAFGYKDKLHCSIGFMIQKINGSHSSIFAIPNGAKAYFKLSDNTVLALNSEISQISEGKVGDTGTATYTKGVAVPIYTIPKEDIEQLVKAPITVIRIETSDGDIDLDVKPKNSEIIKKEVELITAK